MVSQSKAEKFEEYRTGVSLSCHLADVVLLPVQGGVRLNDDVLVRGLLEFVDEHGLARLQCFGDFRVHAQRKIWSFVVRCRHFARFCLNFVAERRDGFHHARAGSIGTRLAEHPFECLLCALAGDADQAKLVEGKRL